MKKSIQTLFLLTITGLGLTLTSCVTTPSGESCSSGSSCCPAKKAACETDCTKSDCTKSDCK